MAKTKYKKMPIVWWKDAKLLIGVILVLLSMILGFYGKIIIISKFYKPVELWTGISIYALSFIFMFAGIFLVGWETIKMIQYKIHHHFRKTVKKTYHHARKLPKRATHYTKKLQDKGMHKIKKASKIIANRMRH